MDEQIKYKKNKQIEEFIVKVIDSKLAKEYTIKNHYMKTFPIPKVCFGLFLNNKLVGVCTFGYSTATYEKVKKIIPKIEENEIIEMQRMNIFVCNE